MDIPSRLYIILPAAYKMILLMENAPAYALSSAGLGFFPGFSTNIPLQVWAFSWDSYLTLPQYFHVFRLQPDISSVSSMLSKDDTLFLRLVCTIQAEKGYRHEILSSTTPNHLTCYLLTA